MEFEVLIDDRLIDCVPDCELNPTDNKYVLSVLNDFEEGAWRYNKFQNYVWDNVALTGLSQRERSSLVGHSHSQLVAAAKNLRLTDNPDAIGEGSELAEIVLYGIMKDHYKALPVVPKIFYKQNSQDNAKGSDSVHIVVNGGDFTLWLGEAKFYKSLEDSRIPPIVASVEQALKADKLRKETSIVTNVGDLDDLGLDPDLVSAIKDALAPKTSIDDLKPKLHIPILLLHECSITARTTDMTDEYRTEVASHHKNRAVKYFEKQIGRIGGIHNYSKVTFHIILFPVPDKTAIVEKFLEIVESYRRR